jgi:hypothetical protein
VLFVISLADRVVKVAGITTRPDEAWMLQMARNLTDPEGGALHAKQYLIIDRDAKYSQQFRRMIRDNGTRVIRLPPMSPNLKELVSYCTSLELLRSDSVRRFNATPTVTFDDVAIAR